MGRRKKVIAYHSVGISSPSPTTEGKGNAKAVVKKKSIDISPRKVKKCKPCRKKSKAVSNSSSCIDNILEETPTKKLTNARRSLDKKPKLKKRIKLESMHDQAENDNTVSVKEEPTDTEESSGEKKTKVSPKNVTRKNKPRSRGTDLKRGASPSSGNPGNQETKEKAVTEKERNRRSGNSLLQFLTSQRRYSRQLADTGLLEDRTIGYHAWSLWSSDQRRPYQQENPDASAEAVDNRLREIWDGLGDKEKLKYYVRAVRAHQRGSGFHRKERERVWNTNKDTLATSLDLDTFSASPLPRREIMVSNSILHLQRRLPQPYFQQMVRTLHCPRGSCCQINHNPFSAHYPGHYHRTCCSDQASKSSRVASNTIWERLSAEESRTHQVNVEYSRWRIAHNHRAYYQVISRAIQQPPGSGDSLDEESSWLGQLLDDLDEIENASQRVECDDKNFGKCKEGHDMIAQIAAELEASTSHVFQLGNESVRVPAVLNIAEEIAIMADVTGQQTIQPLLAQDVDNFFNSCLAESVRNPHECCRQNININDILDQLQQALHPRQMCSV